MFETLQAAPPDPILGLTEAFRADENPLKINLGVGVYQDDSGKTPVLETVREAVQRLAGSQTTKSYLPIPGSPDYASAVQQLALGTDHEAMTSARVATSHTPGGTGALRVAADFLRRNFPKSSVWLSKPTWANHPAIFAAAEVETKTFPYFDPATNGLAFDEMLASLRTVPAGDAVLLHGCCHNPTGIDPTPEQWNAVADVVFERGLLPILDFAYQGFADGIDEDAVGLRALCRPGAELIFCTSFSKNFGLYRERVGAVTFVAASTDAAQVVQSQVKRCIRTNYSNPPAHGAEIVTTILGDSALRTQWESEVGEMRGRIHGMRQLLVEELAKKGAPGDYSFMTQQRGMFSFSGLTPEQVDALREEYSIYIVRSGRINVAGVTKANVERLADAIAKVTSS